MARSRSNFRRLYYYFLIAFSLVCSLTAVGVGFLLGYLKELPPIEQLEDYSPPQNSILLDRTGRIEIGRFTKENRSLVSLQEVPQDMINAFLAVEDVNFYRHFGVDLKGVAAAAVTNVVEMRKARGASTITQQLPRNLLPDVTYEKTWTRKIKETLLAFQIEKRYSKDQILEFYINQINMGRGEVYGVGQAARLYFNKKISDLSLAESATLAGIPKSPNAYAPMTSLERCEWRRNVVLQEMRRRGFISEERYNATRAEPLVLNQPPPVVNRAPYFVEYLRQYAQKQTPLSYKGLREEGLVLETSLDVGLQEAADAALKKGLRGAEKLWQERKKARLAEENQIFGSAAPRPIEIRLATVVRHLPRRTINVRIGEYDGTVKLPEALPYYDPDAILADGELVDVKIKSVDRTIQTFVAELADTKPIQGGLVALDVKTGEILAMVGGENYYDLSNNGMWNRVTQGVVQPGSCIKPFVYAAAMEGRFTPASVFMDEKITYPDGYSPRNYEDMFFGRTTLEEALEHSRNVVTIRLFEALGRAWTVAYIQRFAFASARGWDLAADPTMPLGTNSMTLLELAAGYVPFANHGVATRPRGVHSIRSNKGKLLYEFKPEERIVLDPLTAYQITYMLEGVIARGTGQEPIGDYFAMKPGVPQMAGKTGTTSDFRHALFVGYTPELLCAVEVGYDRPKPLGPKMSGSRVAGPIWVDFMDRALQTRMDWQKEFVVPEELDFADICEASGKLAAVGCRLGGAEIYAHVPFKKGTAPKENCTVH